MIPVLGELEKETIIPSESQVEDGAIPNIIRKEEELQALTELLGRLEA